MQITPIYETTNGDSAINLFKIDSLEHYLSKTLIHLGFMPQNAGFRYAKLGVIYSSSRNLSSITKELYPFLAKTFNVSSCSVERCIRHSIQSAHDKGYLQRLNAILGVTAIEDYAPSNSEFLALLAQHIYFTFDREAISSAMEKLSSGQSFML